MFRHDVPGKSSRSYIVICKYTNCILCQTVFVSHQLLPPISKTSFKRGIYHIVHSLRSKASWPWSFTIGRWFFYLKCEWRRSSLSSFLPVCGVCSQNGKGMTQKGLWTMRVFERVVHPLEWRGTACNGKQIWYEGVRLGVQVLLTKFWCSEGKLTSRSRCIWRRAYFVARVFCSMWVRMTW